MCVALGGYSGNPKPEAVNLKPDATRDLKPEILVYLVWRGKDHSVPLMEGGRTSEIRNPKPETRYPKPEIRNPKPRNRKPKPKNRNLTRKPKPILNPQTPNAKTHTPNLNPQPKSSPVTQNPKPETWTQGGARDGGSGSCSVGVGSGFRVQGSGSGDLLFFNYQVLGIYCIFIRF